MVGLIVLASFCVIPQPNEIRSLEGAPVPTNTPVVVRTDSTIAPEGYRLNVGGDGIVIECADEAGAFYARETLRQLADQAGYPRVSIADAPAYRWRGMLIDEGRHFFGKHVVMKVMDLMARYKMNVLHWHLTEDQGWRLDIPGHPELVKYGAVRPSSQKHGEKLRRLPGREYAAETDGQTYGPYYYTEQDVKEVLAYAAARHIKVVPEIELPGHVFAALAAYPDLACRPENLAKRSPRCIWGIEKDVLCIGNDKAIRFMEDVLDYVCRLFPSDVVHIGGDECPQIRWKDCPKCQKRIRDEGLKDEKDLQPWITRHFVKFLADRGKRSLGWDEYLLGEGIPKTAIGMSWRSGKSGGAGHDWLSPADIAAKGHDVVMTPHLFCYIDYGQGLAEDPYQYIGGNVPLSKCYSLDPCAGVPENLRSHIIGGQGNNWSEYTWNQYDLEWKMWPRGCALAEVFWSGERRPSFGDFRRRVAVHRRQLIRDGVNCAPLGDAPDASMQETLDAYTRSGCVAGVVSALSDADYNVQFDCSGWADAEKRVPIDEHSMMAIFSMTKSFTGIALMCAIDEGKIALDDPIARFLPEFADVRMKDGSSPKRALVLRDFVCHTTGFRGGPKVVNRDIPLREVARQLAALPLQFQPGETFSYGNAWIDTVAACIEVAVGEPFEKYLQRKVLDPLGMTDTTFWPMAEQQKRLVRAYTSTAYPFVPADDVCTPQLEFPKTARIYPAASGGLFSTAADMVRFSQMLAHHGEWKGVTIVSRATFDGIFAVKQTGADVKEPYSTGAWIWGDWIGHEGAMRTDQRANLKTGHSRVFFIQTENKAGKGFFQLKDAWQSTADRLQGTPPTIFGT